MNMTTLIALLVAALVIYLVYRHLNKVTDDTLPVKEEAPVAPVVEPVVAKVEEVVAEQPKKERKKRAPSAKGASKKSAKN